MKADKADRIKRNNDARGQLAGLAAIAGMMIAGFAPAFRNVRHVTNALPEKYVAGIISRMHHARRGTPWRRVADRSHGTRLETFRLARQ